MHAQCLNQKELLPELIPEGIVAIIIMMMIIISAHQSDCKNVCFFHLHQYLQWLRQMPFDFFAYFRQYFFSICNINLLDTQNQGPPLSLCYICVCFCAFCLVMIIQQFLNLTYQNFTQNLVYENYSQLGLQPPMTYLKALMVKTYA